MLRRLFELGCVGATVAPVRAALSRENTCADLAAWALAHARHDFDDLAHDVAGLPPAEGAVFANVAINRLVVLADDLELGAVDVWQTPFELLARGRGDCEDIAIAKFFLLLAAGADPAEVRLLYARRRHPATPGRATPHVVTVARHPFADPLVLDNVNLMALPVSCRDDLEPVFSFDRAQLWAGVNGPCHGSAPERLHAWRALLARMPLPH
jgi:predicted transglutaminase-like cysteine proteinase